MAYRLINNHQIIGYVRLNLHKIIFSNITARPIKYANEFYLLCFISLLVESYWTSLIARFMWPTWGPYGADRTQVAPCRPRELGFQGLPIFSKVIPLVIVHSHYQTPTRHNTAPTVYMFLEICCLMNRFAFKLWKHIYSMNILQTRHDSCTVYNVPLQWRQMSIKASPVTNNSITYSTACSN